MKVNCGDPEKVHKAKEELNKEARYKSLSSYVELSQKMMKSKKTMRKEKADEEYKKQNKISDRLTRWRANRVTSQHVHDDKLKKLDMQ